MKVAFYDFDGTLVSSNVVSRYFHFARRAPGLRNALWRSAVTLGGIPYWLWLDARSRAEFNRRFFRLYRGLERTWLDGEAERLFEQEIRPTIFPGTAKLLEDDRREGFDLVLVTGGLDFVVAPAARHFGFERTIMNRMVFDDSGRATGEIAPPLLAEEGKVEAIQDFCRRYNVDTEGSKAYSDSFSDVPMLECVGRPAAVNPDKRLEAVARERNWPVIRTR